MTKRWPNTTSSLLRTVAMSAMGLVLFAAPVLAAGPPPPPPPGGTPPPPAAPTTTTTTPPPAAPTVAPPPAPNAPAGGPNAQGEASYKGEDYEAAAIQFFKIYSGEIPGDQPRAQFWLGKTLYK